MEMIYYFAGYGALLFGAYTVLKMLSRAQKDKTMRSLQIDIFSVGHNAVVGKVYTGSVNVTIVIDRSEYDKLVADGFFVTDTNGIHQPVNSSLTYYSINIPEA